MKRFVVVGEALVDNIDAGGGRERYPGGSPLNVAVGLARLGSPVRFFTTLADDDDGAMVQLHAARSGVALEAAVTTRTSSAFVLANALDGSPEYRFDIAWEPSMIPDFEADIAHTGSIAATLTPGCESVLAWMRRQRRRSLMSYDPNIRPGVTGTGEDVVALVEEAVSLSDIVKVSREDLDALYGPEPSLSVAARWLDYGATMVVVTNGGRAATAFRAKGEVSVPAVVVPVVDTVGAGDSFAAAFLHALARSSALPGRAALLSVTDAVIESSLRFASRCAAITVGRAGANPPHLEEVGEAY